MLRACQARTGASALAVDIDTVRAGGRRTFVLKPSPGLRGAGLPAVRTLAC